MNNNKNKGNNIKILERCCRKPEKKAEGKDKELNRARVTLNIGLQAKVLKLIILLRPATKTVKRVHKKWSQQVKGRLVPKK